MVTKWEKVEMAGILILDAEVSLEYLQEIRT